MTLVKTKDVVGDRRSVMQQARLAIRDIYDAIVELVTNSDDRYQHLNVDGTIEIVVERGRGKAERLLQARDFADGMTLGVMDEKLSRTGGRVSGMEAGLDVRGTNSRGAKDIAALRWQWSAIHRTPQIDRRGNGVWNSCHGKAWRQPLDSAIRQSSREDRGTGLVAGHTD